MPRPLLFGQMCGSASNVFLRQAMCVRLHVNATSVVHVYLCRSWEVDLRSFSLYGVARIGGDVLPLSDLAAWNDSTALMSTLPNGARVAAKWRCKDHLRPYTSSLSDRVLHMWLSEQHHYICMFTLEAQFLHVHAGAWIEGPFRPTNGVYLLPKLLDDQVAACIFLHSMRRSLSLLRKQIVQMSTLKDPFRCRRVLGTRSPICCCSSTSKWRGCVRYSHPVSRWFEDDLELGVVF